jgi:hypothetical protein
MKLWQVEVIVDFSGSQSEAYTVTLWAPSVSVAIDAASAAIRANLHPHLGQHIRSVLPPQEMITPTNLTIVAIERAGGC